MSISVFLVKTLSETTLLILTLCLWEKSILTYVVLTNVTGLPTTCDITWRMVSVIPDELLAACDELTVRLK
jgi:hypothetical protein